MITYAMKSMPGNRKYNEDYMKVQETGDRWIFAIADGLGGCGYGGLASETAVNSIFAPVPDFPNTGFFEYIFRKAQNAVLAAQNICADAKDMCTTLVVLKLEGGYAQWAHVGDSRLYRFRKWFLKEQTLDHSVPQMLVNIGEIRPGQIRHHADRSRLLKVVGRPWQGSGYTLSEKIPLKRGDAFLLCTDGFWEYITEHEMCRCIRKSGSAREWLDQMLQVVEMCGSGADMDNFSAICIRVN